MEDGVDTGRIEEIGREECLELLQKKSKVGRVAFVEEGRPTIRPVNYQSDGESVVFCTTPGGHLGDLADGSQVAFEVDGSVSLEHSGWSVLVHGAAHEITDPQELVRLRRGSLQSWGVGESQYWVRISIEEISGRRIPAR